MQAADRMIYKASPILATGVLLGSVYWTAVTYGAITVMQVIQTVVGCEMQHKVFLLLIMQQL